MLLVLFDIDGTLLRTGGAGWASFCDTFEDAFQVPALNEVACAGRTDRGIVTDLFRSHGISDTDGNWRRFHDGYCRHLETRLPRHEGTVLAAVRPVLEQLANRPDVVLGLLTGNVRRGAQLKLHYYELASYFVFGAYGDRHREREALAIDAFQTARGTLGHDLEPERVWVVGDTPLDVGCARAFGARAMAVASGSAGREALADARPDVLLDDLCDVERVVDHLTGAAGGAFALPAVPGATAASVRRRKAHQTDEGS